MGAGFVLLASVAYPEETFAGSAVMYVYAGALGSVGAITGTIVDMVVGRRQTVYRKASTPGVRVAPLAVVLMVVGAKMMTHVWLKTLLGQHVNLYLLAVVLLILAAGVGASLLASRRERARKDSVVRPDAA